MLFEYQSTFIRREPSYCWGLEWKSPSSICYKANWKVWKRKLKIKNWIGLLLWFHFGWIFALNRGQSYLGEEEEGSPLLRIVEFYDDYVERWEEREVIIFLFFNLIGVWYWVVWERWGNVENFSQIGPWFVTHIYVWWWGWNVIVVSRERSGWMRRVGRFRSVSPLTS